MAPVPLRARVVEVIACLGGSYRYGSGFIVREGTVLTAAHVVAGAVSVTVRDPDKREFPASADPRFTGDADGPGPDLALVEIDDPGPGLPPVGLARVDRDSPTGDPVKECQVIGYPAFMEQETPDGGQVRETADASGHVPVLSRLAGGLLSVQVTHRPRPLPPKETALGESQWSGMSGAPVLAGGLLLGVVSEHAPREGSSAITATPLTALEADPAHPGWGPGVADPDAWWARLGVPGVSALRLLPPRPEEAGRRSGEAVAAGWPLEEVTDPFALEVHRPVQLEHQQPAMPELPAYVPRDHDTELGRVVRAAAEGRSGIAVLVGGSSTGKTRACWQALQPLRDQPERWRLWHPIDPSRPGAALRELPAIGPRTVVWLNEAQLYLGPAGGIGEQVAAGLRELLRDPDRGPVLVLATLWPQFWDTLTRRPPAGQDDPHAQARDLLAGHDITVPPAFTAAQLQEARQAGDPRLARAAGAEDGQVIQFLAGAPELLARYRNAPPGAIALIHTAMDARRLGAGISLPQAFLEAAAPGYLSDADWDTLDEDWLEQALAYTAVHCKGARGPLTRIRPRPASSRATPPGAGDDGAQAADGQASIPGVPLYRLADYLDQHGRRTRQHQFPPAGFWTAAASCASPGDQAALGDAAYARGLYRADAQLHKNAAARGNLNAVSYFRRLPHYLRADVSSMRWAVAHVPLDDPYAVARLLDSLRQSDAQDQAAALLGRDPAAHVSLDNPSAVGELLSSLREAGAQEQAAALASRAVAHAPLDDPVAVAWLLNRLREAGAEEQAAALASGAVAHAPLDDPAGVAWLLDNLRRAGAQEEAAALLGRDPAAHASLDDPAGVAWLLDNLREAGAQEQAAALLGRDPAAHVPLDDPVAVARLLDSLREAGAQEQAAALLGRDPAARAPLDDSAAVSLLLASLREAGAQEQVAALADRAAAHVPLSDPAAVSLLLDNLRKVGAEEQAAALLGRDPAAHAPLDDPAAVSLLLASLRRADAEEQAAALLGRDPAAHVPLDDPAAVSLLLDSLREAGAQEEAAALLGRDPAAHVPLDDPFGAARLLASLRRAGAEEQAAALTEWLPGAGMFEVFLEQEGNQDRFRFGREANGSPAQPWGWNDLD